MVQGQKKDIREKGYNLSHFTPSPITPLCQVSSSPRVAAPFPSETLTLDPTRSGNRFEVAADAEPSTSSDELAAHSSSSHTSHRQTTAEVIPPRSPIHSTSDFTSVPSFAELDASLSLSPSRFPSTAEVPPSIALSSGETSSSRMETARGEEATTMLPPFRTLVNYLLNEGERQRREPEGYSVLRSLSFSRTSFTRTHGHQGSTSVRETWIRRVNSTNDTGDYSGSPSSVVENDFEGQTASYSERVPRYFSDEDEFEGDVEDELEETSEVESADEDLHDSREESPLPLPPFLVPSQAHLVGTSLHRRLPALPSLRPPPNQPDNFFPNPEPSRVRDHTSSPRTSTRQDYGTENYRKFESPELMDLFAIDSSLRRNIEAISHKLFGSSYRCSGRTSATSRDPRKYLKTFSPGVTPLSVPPPSGSLDGRPQRQSGQDENANTCPQRRGINGNSLARNSFGNLTNHVVEDEDDSKDDLEKEK